MVELSWADLITSLPVILTTAHPHVYATLIGTLGVSVPVGWLIEHRSMLCRNQN